MGYALSSLSRRRLRGVHPDLVRVVERAIELTPVDFRIQEGLRTKARQVELVKAGASQTLASRHITGHAVDVVALVGKVPRWDWPLYGYIAAAMKGAAKDLAIPLIWGGDWRTLKDGPHFELPKSRYPA